MNWCSSLGAAAVTWRIKEIDELSGLVIIKNQSHMQKLDRILRDIHSLCVCSGL